MAEKVPAGWFLYIVETAAGAWYTGISTDVTRRFDEHRRGQGAKALRGRGPLRLVHHEAVGTRSEASRLEASVKRLTAAGKRRWLAARLAPQPAPVLVPAAAGKPGACLSATSDAGE